MPTILFLNKASPFVSIVYDYFHVELKKDHVPYKPQIIPSYLQTKICDI